MTRITVTPRQLQVTVVDCEAQLVIESRPMVIEVGGGLTVGGGGSSAAVLEQLSAAAFWSFVNPFGRLAAVAVYRLDGEEVGADVICTTTSVTVTFAQPFAGRLVLN